MQKSHPKIIRAWTRLVRAEQHLMGEIETRLKAAGLPGLDWYDILLEIKRDCSTGIRPADLESRLLIAQYNLSRIIARIEKAGLISRAPDPDDGRSHRLIITQAGLNILDRAWPVYDGALSDLIGSKLSPSEAQSLGKLLKKLT